MISNKAIRCVPICRAQVRNFASLKDLQSRMKTVSNIQKITRAMRLIAAAKIRSLQTALTAVRVFQKPISDVIPKPSGKVEDANFVIVAITPDKGLCGSIGAQVIRKIGQLNTELEQQKKSFQLIVLGEKGRSGMERIYKQKFVWTVSDIYKSKFILFNQVCQFANALLKDDFDRIDIVYNKFKNMLSFQLSIETIHSYDAFYHEYNKTHLNKYELEDETMRNLYEYWVAIRLFHCLQENATSEMSARLNAMSNSSKSAEDLLVSLNSQYNRQRQGQITSGINERVNAMVAMEGGDTDD
eukprot:TRINITY_DN1130_c0_g1_i1.p1 TRINITY_DN1130_c0_g1~~TRINITY_DN1130_c0_g1_i1.p1  ORF type:complete len:299 (-),score=53.31 TRINITY_DN1130_c0_g1_i1:539-1435(-)